MAIRLNLGCGSMYLEGYVNVDKYNLKADIKADIVKLPFANDTVESVLMSHVIEHIPWKKHVDVFEEVYRVIQQDGVLQLAYPEFSACAEMFITNKDGKKWSWWVQTLYGHQMAEGQAHLAPADTEHFIDMLSQIGFYNFNHELFGVDSVLTCKKGSSMPWFDKEVSINVVANRL